MKRSVILSCMGLLMAIQASFAAADIVIGGTRVVYPADAREVSVQLTNNGDSPSLVQAWVDSGDPNTSPETSDAPFVLFPPISRVEPATGQVLRLSFTGDTSLPRDRESLFWLNVLDVPPTPQAGQSAPDNFLQLAFRSRIKLFYRPDGLPGRANSAPESLSWRLSQDAGGQRVLVGTNPTPYHVNMTRVELRAGDSSLPLEIGDGMLPPMGSVSFSLPPSVPFTPTDVGIVSINDYGGRVPRDFPLSR